HCRYIPLETIEQVVALAEGGATVLMPVGFPDNISGYHEYEARSRTYAALINSLKLRVAGSPGVISTGKGKILIGEDIKILLDMANVKGETLGELGVIFLRKKTSSSTLY